MFRQPDRVWTISQFHSFIHFSFSPLARPNQTLQIHLTDLAIYQSAISNKLWVDISRVWGIKQKLLLMKQTRKYALRHEEEKFPLGKVKTSNSTGFLTQTLFCKVCTVFYSHLHFLLCFNCITRIYFLIWKHCGAPAGWWSHRFPLAILQKWVVYAVKAAVTHWMCSGRLAKP